jgi:hypothetical protein
VIVVAFVVLAAFAFGVGVLVGRWSIVILCAAVFPIYFLGLQKGWWGNGTGDGWQILLVVGTAAAMTGSAAGVRLRRSAKPSKRVA